MNTQLIDNSQSRRVGIPAPSVTLPPETEKSGVATDEQSESQAHTRRVAVVGVHGVAHHAPGATANAMADLLLSLPASDHDEPRYFSSFETIGIQVPLQRLVVNPPAKVKEPKTAFGRMFNFLQEESANFARTTRGYAARTLTGNIRGFAGHEFMRSLLYRYEGGADGDAYVTTRLEGNRNAQAPGGPANIHIYEVLWADLAQPANSFLSFFFALFQLIFHLGSLSRLAIDTGAAKNDTWLWVAFRRTHRYAVRMLQIPLPLLKLILLIALYSCIPAVLPATKDHPSWFPLAIGGVLGIVIYFLLIRKSRRTVSPGVIGWAIRPLLGAALGVAAVGIVLLSKTLTGDSVAAIECWIVGAALIWYVLSYYEDMRKGAGWIGWFLYSCLL